MRIRKLIEMLEAVERKHGNVHIRARDRHGDDGPPAILKTTVIRGSTTFVRWEVTTKGNER